jgi:hypothetical protein
VRRQQEDIKVTGIAALARPLAQRDAIHARHVAITDHDGAELARQQMQRFFATRGNHRLIAGLLHHRDQVVSRLRIIVDDQHAQLGLQRTQIKRQRLLVYAGRGFHGHSANFGAPL